MSEPAWYRKQVCDACDGCGLLKGGGIGSQAKVCKKCQGSGKVPYLTPTDRCHGPRLVR